MCSTSGVAGAGAGPSPAAVLDAIQTLAAAGDLGSLSDAVLLDRFRELNQARCAMDSLFATMAGAVHARGAGGHDGCPSTKAWMRSQLRMSPRDAGAYVDAGAALPDLPSFAGEFAAGRVGLDHVGVMAGLRKKAGSRVAGIGDQLLKDYALEDSAKELRRVAERVREHFQTENDPERKPEPERFLKLAQTIDGVWYLRGGLTAEGGAMLRTALDAAMPRPAPDDDRTTAERRHDAFLDLIRLGLDSGKLPERGGEPVHLGALVSLDDLREVQDRRGRTVPQPPPSGSEPGVEADSRARVESGAESGAESESGAGVESGAGAEAESGAGVGAGLSEEIAAYLAALENDLAARPEEPDPATGMDADTEPLYVPVDWSQTPAGWIPEYDLPEYDLPEYDDPITPDEDVLAAAGATEPDFPADIGPEWFPAAWLPDLGATSETCPGQRAGPGQFKHAAPPGGPMPGGRTGLPDGGTPWPDGGTALPAERQLTLPELGHTTTHLPQPGEGARTDYGDHLTPEAARRLGCDAGIYRVVLGPRDVPLSAGQRTRLVPPSLRRILVARDGGCRFPGCDRPPAYTQAHHVKYWAEGGPTTANNLILLCSFHHHRVHDDGWTLHYNAVTNTVAAYRPDGTQLRLPGAERGEQSASS